MSNVGTGRNGSLLPVAVLGGIVLLTAARVAVVWSDLPPRMASHFGVNGVPDGFMPRAAFFTFLGVVLGGTMALMVALPLMLRFVPVELINLPNKDYWLVPERRDAAFTRLGSWLGWLNVATAALLYLVIDLTIRANLTHERLDSTAFVAGLAVYGVVVVSLLVMLVRGFRVPVAVA